MRQNKYCPNKICEKKDPNISNNCKHMEYKNDTKMKENRNNPSNP